MEKTRKRKKVDNKKTLAFKKLKLLITIVNRNKAEYYLDLLQSQEINCIPQAGHLSLSHISKCFSPT